MRIVEDSRVRVTLTDYSTVANLVAGVEFLVLGELARWLERLAA